MNRELLFTQKIFQKSKLKDYKIWSKKSIEVEPFTIFEIYSTILKRCGIFAGIPRIEGVSSRSTI